jgi:hypothetical protein
MAKKQRCIFDEKTIEKLRIYLEKQGVDIKPNKKAVK